LIEIGSDRLSAIVNPRGAELSSLRDADGRELMTNADPAFWDGRAPILFPIVGRLNGDVLRIDGEIHPMKQHGFARRLPFDLCHRDTDRVVFRLVDSLTTREQYPFAYLLEIGFAIAGATLSMTARIGNIGEEPMPASFGWHPAFAWPLPYGGAREAHRIVFAEDEPEPLKALQDGLVAGARPTPVAGNALALDDALFAGDALILDPVRSRRLRYGIDGLPGLAIDFPDTPRLGIWTKPGAGFVCIEPWHGIADPAGYEGDFRDKPGVFEIAPGDSWQCEMRVTLAA
jgi:galactose mutarotase-like enzyme